MQGILDHNLRQVRVNVVPDVKRETLQNILLKNLTYGAKIYTEERLDLPELAIRGCFAFFFMAASFGTLKSAFIPSSKLSVAFLPSKYSGCFIMASVITVEEQSPD
ncbi:MAG: hypothetical protein JWQ87_4164 [Candidatus Sulfotelmatobacter sp.]|nr:hypothetical protein [Candidatus Sulfotelmatobacter sp.]